MALTKEQIEKASKEAVKNSERVVKTWSGMKLTDWAKYGETQERPFTPNLTREDSREYLKKQKGVKWAEKSGLRKE